MMLLRLSLVVVTLSIFSLSGCPQDQAVCAANQTRTCSCADSQLGQQTCSADGHEWSACSCDSPTDAGTHSDAAQSDVAAQQDAGQTQDALANDSSSADSRIDDAGGGDSAIADAGGEDAGSIYPRPGFGAISGACDVLDTELTDSVPSLFVNHLDFGTDPYDDSDYVDLTSGGQQMIDVGNANVNSLYSEVFAYEVLARCEDAALLETENTIQYDTQGKITDLEVLMDDIKIGVSVVRAVHWPHEDPYTVAEASEHLSGKLLDIQESSANVSAEDAWQKQVLSVIAYNQQSADAVEEAWNALDASVKADTIVVVTVSDGDDGFMY